MGRKNNINITTIKKMSSSSQLPFNVASAARQALLIGSGFSREELSRPMVGVIVQQSNKIHPGHTNLSELAIEVSKGVQDAGGVAVKIDVGGFCDGVMLPNPKYTFAQRNQIVNMIEIAAIGNMMDALVLLASCDKNVPSALMAAARINIPTIVVLGGSMTPGNYKGKKVNFEDVIHSVGKVTKNEMNTNEFDGLVDSACEGEGACCCMTTGTTMQIVTEALGMCLPGNSSCLGSGNEIKKMARESGQSVMKLWENETRPRDIINKESISNAIKVCLSVGGSIHAMYHIPAIALEAGLKIDIWDDFDQHSNTIPTLVGIAPNGQHDIEDYDNAGGTPSIMNMLSKHLSGDVMAVTGEPIRSYYENAVVKNKRVIHSMEDPWSTESGIAVLKGNLARGGSVLRVSGVLPTMMTFRGKAIVFNLESEAIQYVRSENVLENTIMVLINQGLIGAPGINTLQALACEIVGRGLEEKVAVITDGRFSGGVRGLCIGLVSPESVEGSGISIVKTGDFIEIDVRKRRIHLDITDVELENRKKIWRPYEPEYTSPLLENFTKSVGPIHQGAVEGLLDRGKYKFLS